MTKYRKKIEEHVEEKWAYSKVLCDICYRDVSKVNKGSHTEITLDAKIGTHYGTEGDTRDGYVLDVCEECFINKLKPLIEKELSITWKEYEPEEAYLQSNYGKYFEDES